MELRPHPKDCCNPIASLLLGVIFHVLLRKMSVLCAIVQMHQGPNIPEKQAIFLLVSNSMENAGAAMTQKIVTIYMTGDRTA